MFTTRTALPPVTSQRAAVGAVAERERRRAGREDERRRQRLRRERRASASAPGPSSCLPAGSLCVLPAASRTVNGEREETTTFFEPGTSSTRTRFTGAWPSSVPG